MIRYGWAWAAVGMACAVTQAADWSQWRGPARTGYAEQSPPLIDSLPDDGMPPAWIFEDVPGGGRGGWSSPVVAGDRVFLFVHTKTQLGDPPKKQYPWLPPERRTGMTDEEYQEYEQKRRDEDEKIASFFRFEEILYCVDAATGEEIWRSVTPSHYTRFLHSGTPAVVDDRIYVLGAGYTARCFDRATGEEVWSTKLPGEFRDQFMMSSFAVVDGVAAVFCERLFGLDAETGEILWEPDPQEASGTHTSAVAWEHAGEKYLIAHVNGKYTAAIDPHNGQKLWQVETSPNNSTPLVVGDRLLTYGGSRKSGLRCYQMDASGASEVWTYHRVADKGSSPVVVDNLVFVQGERRLACVDLETGKEQWNALLDLARPQYTSLIAADGKVFYGCDGVLCLEATGEEFKPLFSAKIDRNGLMATEAAFRERLQLDELEAEEDGAEKALRKYNSEVGRHGPLECSTPAIADGRLFVRLKNALACYDLRAGSRSE